MTYRYVRTVSGRALGRRWLHLYVLDPADQDMTWQAHHPPRAWELPEDSGRKAARRLHRR